MGLPLFNDAIDDVPDDVGSDGFEGFDSVAEATKLLPSILRVGRNMWVDTDNLAQTRPGLQFNTQLTATTIDPVRGLGYYDTPGFERILAVQDAKLFEIISDENNEVSNHLTGPLADTGRATFFAQLVDRMFWCDGSIQWSWYSAGWTHGLITTFADASTMPAWKTICSHKFRLLAVSSDGRTIYASAIGDAALPANWVKTENFRVGSGEGDPIVSLISGQGGNLVVICEKSAWSVNTSAANVSDWNSDNITNLAGCVAAKTAVQVGQDVIYLSSFGVVSLGALATTDSISPEKTLSVSVDNYIRRINKAARDTSWAVMWRDVYLLAVPIDASEVPNVFLPFNTTTRRWGAPWDIGASVPDVGSTAFEGFSAGVLTSFGANKETLIADNAGRVLRFDDLFTKDASSAEVTQEILSWCTSKSYAHDYVAALKQPFWLEVDWFRSSGAQVQINLVRDGVKTYPDKPLNECEIVAAGLVTNSSSGFPIAFPFTLQATDAYTKPFNLRNFPRYRNVAVQIVSQQGKMRVRAVRLASFIDSPKLA